MNTVELIEHRNVEKSCLNQVRTCNFSALETICVHDLFNSFEILLKNSRNVYQFLERCVLNDFLSKVHDKYKNRYEYELKCVFESRKTFSLSTKSRLNLMNQKVSSSFQPTISCILCNTQVSYFTKNHLVSCGPFFRY